MPALRAADHRATADIPGLAILACLAIVFPTLIAYNVAPSATIFNQVAAFVGWGGFLLVLGTWLPRRAWPRARGALALLASLALLVLAALGASLWAAVPWALSLSNAGTMLAAILAIAMGACAERAGLGERAFRACCIALTVAGVASSAIGLVQVFAPNLPDGDWVALAAIPGRATGNLRQPNHLSSLLLWSIVAVLWLGERRVIYREVAGMLALVFVWVVMLSASRTGLIGIVTLAGWGLLDRRLSRATRVMLLCAPLAYAALWGGTVLWAHLTHGAFGAEERFTGSGIYVSYSRYAIWANSLAMIAMHPWVGVGFGEFNFAWTLTPFPNRPVAFFDHAHNLMLQFAVEMGLPLATLVVALLGYALLEAMRNALASGRTSDATYSTLRGKTGTDAALADTGPMQRAAFVMVLMVGMHSLLEYPLWYAYFLLPAAFVFGLCVERPDPGDVARAEAAEANVTRPFVLVSMLLILGGTLALYDYLRVVVIFAPPANAGPLEQRIADGRHSILFAHHADYAAATVNDRPGNVMKAFERAPHYLLDARLLQAWAQALDERGEVDKARYVAERLKEFHNDQSDEFFAACKPASAAGAAAAASAASAASARAAPASAAAPPFQCSAPTREYRFEDFR
ncbi:MAG: Wzy polymerase domain-containing protein [Caldimonas sp.]